MHSPTSNLSPEIFHQIFGYFCLHCCGERREYLLEDPADLADEYRKGRKVPATLSLVNRHIRDSSRDILYHVFLIAPSKPGLVRQPSVETSLPSFIRTIASNFRLAVATKVVIFFSYT
ncbi:hypothetical protein NXS19_012598 [Fusarium pseudograminearum]|nr:hypothetical protein NXS19_012598 [Fusarium pseudograminearum]